MSVNLNFKKGQRLVVELASLEVFEGDYESGSKTRVDLSNVVEYPSTLPLVGTHCFYSSDIRSICIVGADLSASNCSSKEESSSTEPDLTHVILLPEQEYERLKNLMFESIYMATTDRRYHAAIEDLNNSENVAVVGLGSQYGRSNKLQLLLLATWKQIYIFDIAFFNRKDFEPELKDILESPYIKKIVHDSRGVVDCLYHCHNVQLQNIFDTQVADKIINKTVITKPPESRSLSQCLSHYFHLPVNLIEQAEETDIKKWQKRPITDAIKKRASILASYLITLKNKLEELMLSDFYEDVKNYSLQTKYASCYKPMLTIKSTRKTL